MEPFRPLVDRAVAKLKDERSAVPTGGTGSFPLDQEAKCPPLEALLARFTAEGESRTLFDWVSRAASSLAAVIEGDGEKLEIPRLEIENPQS